MAAYAAPAPEGYAAVAGLPVVAGLWALVAALAVYVVVGTSPQLSVGPGSLVAVSDNVLTARAFAGRTRTTISANQELLARGAGLVA